MRVTVRDEAVLRAVQPQELVAYLRSRGWHEHAGRNPLVDVWSKHDGGDDFEVVVPLDPALGDYAGRIHDALRTLEIAEQRSQLAILRDIATATADVIRIPATRADMRDGTISINDGFAFYQSARDLLMSAACAAIEPRSYYAARRPGQVSQYLDRARFGQTEHGSYVLTIVSPVPPRLAAEALDEGEVEEPYERQVTTTLMKALAAARGAADRAAATGKLDGFEEAVASGVSANFCQALVGLAQHGGEPNAELEIAVSWAPTRPDPGETPARVRLPAGAVPIFAEAARVFKATAPEPDFELRGYVSHLDRPESAAEGTVTLRGFVDGRPRAVELRLGEPEYAVAVKAHAERLPVFCVGELRKRGSTYLLEHPREVKLESVGS